MNGILTFYLALELKLLSVRSLSEGNSLFEAAETHWETFTWKNKSAIEQEMSLIEFAQEIESEKELLVKDFGDRTYFIPLTFFFIQKFEKQISF